MIRLAISILWVACGLGAAGMMIATGRARHPELYNQPGNPRLCRTVVIGGAIATAPISLPITLLLTGFAYDGWTLDCGKVEK